MICQKCEIEFDEHLIQVSHDIPKYMGGTDADGRHNLCKDCHKEYEAEVLKIGLMTFIQKLPEKEKGMFRNCANIVRCFFFK